MNARETSRYRNESTQPKHQQRSMWKPALRATSFVALAAIVGCAAQPDDSETSESEQALMAATNDTGASVVSTNKLQTTTVQKGTTVRGGGLTVLGPGTVVVDFHKDPDGAWHCTGDDDCNKMFLSGVCTGGILDTSCDTTHGVECWCYN